MDIRFLMAQKCSSGIFQNYLVFLSAKTYIKYLSTLLKLIRGNLMEYQKKIVKILLNQTAILHQLLLIMYHHF